jgi:hypothetical protein
MRVIPAPIQTVDEIYRLIWTAVANKQPIEAMYQARFRLFCPHRLGRNRARQLRVLCYQYGGESQSGLQPMGSPMNWRCIAPDKLSRVKLLEGAWRTAPNHSRPDSCMAESRYRCGQLSRAGSTKRTLRKLPMQLPGKDHSQCRDRIRIMPLGPNAATRAGGNPSTAAGQ